MKDRKDFTEPDYCLKPDFYKLVSLANYGTALFGDLAAKTTPRSFARDKSLYQKWAEKLSTEIFPDKLFIMTWAALVAGQTLPGTYNLASLIIDCREECPAKAICKRDFEGN